jgi:hypothetical protein
MVDQSYDKAMGARPLKRFIDNEIKDKLADMILAGELNNEEVIINFSKLDGEFSIKTQPFAAEKPTPIIDKHIGGEFFQEHVQPGL